MAKRGGRYIKGGGFSAVRRYSSRVYIRRRSLKRIRGMAVNAGAVILIVLILILIWRFATGRNKSSISVEDVAAFRVPYKAHNEIYVLSEKYGVAFPELLTYYALANDFFPAKRVPPEPSEIEASFIMDYSSQKSKYSKMNPEPYIKLFQSLFDEIKCFPIAENEQEDASYMYGDSWGSARSYGGERTHEGTDIIDRENIRGRIPIISMTDGIIKNIGWNELGGYRIGITSESGCYYYYAHFDSFAGGLAEGTPVQAGQLLGYMGDTGYSKKEGTTGNFHVHLHVGIAPDTSIAKDFWINPYPFLRFVETSKEGA